MKKSRSIVEERQENILALISENGNVSVIELANRFQVSLPTIRRDLQFLEDEHFLERFYGGAKRGINLNEKDVHNEKDVCREKIARYAASFVEDGDSIFVNTSSTALRMIKYIKSRNVTIITNNGNAINMDCPPGVTVVLTGGELRYVKGAMVGDFTVGNLSKVTAKKSFLGCSGISVESGMTTEFINEVHINEMMFSRITGTAYILADYTKIGQNSSFVSCSIDKITDIITDSKLSEKDFLPFRDRGVAIHRVP